MVRSPIWIFFEMGVSRKIPSFDNNFWSSLISLRTMHLRYLLWFFYRLREMRNWVLRSLWLRSILLTKLLVVHFFIAERAYLLLRDKFAKATVLTLLRMCISLISDLLRTILVLEGVGSIEILLLLSYFAGQRKESLLIFNRLYLV